MSVVLTQRAVISIIELPLPYLNYFRDRNILHIYVLGHLDNLPLGIAINNHNMRPIRIENFGTK